MRVLVTGANGFVAKNLLVHLNEMDAVEVSTFTRENSESELKQLVIKADFIFHLAGVNRPDDDSEFELGNADLTALICQCLEDNDLRTPILLSSSTQAEVDNPYGRSKLLAEQHLTDLMVKQGNPAFIYRLTNVFGKWSRPNYNSVVATFCHNIASGAPIQINAPDAPVNLVYIDDVITSFLCCMSTAGLKVGQQSVEPVYSTTVGQLASQLQSFKDSRDSLIIEPVGTGFVRALYSTYVSYFDPETFSYEVPMHGDERGVFVEMLKTGDSGQFSFFTAHPGITRGGHYHHTKTEKFLVIKGNARFGFRHIESNKYHEIFTDGGKAVIVETVPGWTHDVTNVGEEEMVVMLWANEIFDREKPDTYACQVKK